MSVKSVDKKTLTYQSAAEELKQIVNAIENGQIGIDTLSEQIERASELIAFCKIKLRDIEARLP